MVGTVFTIPASCWHDADLLVGTWPPAHSGKQAKCMKWQAHIEGGDLVLVQDAKNELKCALRSFAECNAATRLHSGLL